MLIVVIGGSGSGKSEFAENIAVQLNQSNLVYIATMQPFDEEGKKRVIRHQQMRQGKKFETMECYTDMKKLILQNKATVLLECMSNLVANEMFSEFGAKEKTLDAVKQGIEMLMQQTDNLLIVTNNVFEDGIQYDNETMKYLQVLGKLNQWISSMADQVIEVVHGIPIIIKSKNSNQERGC